MENQNSVPPQLPADFIYTRCYCEENVYMLCQAFLRCKDVHEQWEIWVVFISNETKTVALWEQKAALEAGAPVVWDYHVILVLEPKLANRTDVSGKELAHPINAYYRYRDLDENKTEGVQEETDACTWVYDYDTLIQPVPCKWSEWIAKTFPFDLVPQFKSLFRLIRGEDFINWFASDRSHMLLPSVEGHPPSYISPPPVHDPICGELSKNVGVTNNLMEQFVCMDSRAENTFGDVMTLEEVVCYWTR